MEKIKALSELLNREDNRWYNLRPEIIDLFETDCIEELLNIFEIQIENINTKKNESTLIFFVAILLLVEKEDEYIEIAEIVKDKKYLNYLKGGCIKYLTAKSEIFRYEILSKNYFKENLYEKVKAYANSCVDYKYKLIGFFNVLELFRYVNQEVYLDILKMDKQKILLTASIFNQYNLNLNVLKTKWIKQSEDLFLHLVTLYYLINRHQFTEKEISVETQVILFFNDIGISKKERIIMYYMCSNDDYKLNLSFLLQESSVKTIITFLNDIKPSIREQIEFLNFFRESHVFNELANYVYLQFLEWLKDEGDLYTWKKTEKSILSLLKDVSSAFNVISDLIDIKQNLCISSFDRQVRYPQYLKDITKKDIINSCLSNSVK